MNHRPMTINSEGLQIDVLGEAFGWPADPGFEVGGVGPGTRLSLEAHISFNRRPKPY